ncbi:hypothetical protein ACOMHN_025539 [Nucella lapillus]
MDKIVSDFPVRPVSGSLLLKSTAVGVESIVPSCRWGVASRFVELRRSPVSVKVKLPQSHPPAPILYTLLQLLVVHLQEEGTELGAQ